MVKRKTALVTVAICAILLLLYELALGDMLLSSLDEMTRYLADMAITRALGAAAFAVILLYLGYKALLPNRAALWQGVAFGLPAFAVAINNFPFSCIIRGEAVITAPVGRIILLILECISVALFEELAFRGVVLLGFVEKARSRLGLFVAIILSSAVFGVIHLLNLFTSSPAAVIMQIGYSFLIGGMCAVILLKTKNIWLCVASHAIFNFGGAIISTCGQGEIWDSFTVIFTAILALATFVYMLVAFLKIDMSSVDEIYEK